MNSIKRKLTTIILIGVLIPFVAYNLMNHFYTLRSLEKQAASSNLDLNRAIGGTVEEFFEKIYSVSENLIASSEINSMKPSTQKKYIEDTYKRNDFLKLISVTDENGIQISRSSGLNIDTSKRVWFKAVKKELRPFTTEAHFSDRDNSVVVGVISPIMPAESFKGALAIEADLSAIRERLSSFKSKKDATVYIIDNEGNVVFRSDKEVLTEKMNLITMEKKVLIRDSNNDVLLDFNNNQSEKQEPFNVNRKLSEAAKDAIQGGTGSSIYHDGKVKKILSYTNIKVIYGNGDWAVLVVEDYNNAMSFATNALRNSFGLGALQLIILLILSFYLSKMITNPMKVITDGVRAIKNGRLEYRISIKGKDEFSELGEAFNGMASGLMDSYEQQIRKNRELKGINMELEASNSQLIAAIKQLNETEDNLRAAFEKTVMGLISAVEAKDMYTESHSIRVANYSVAIAERMGYGIRKKEDLWVAGVLHDIGKIGIPDMILNKAGKLTEDEYREIKQHPVIACKMLSKIDLSREIMEAIRYHHERCDGKGYPDCLTAKEIPEMAAIISVADAFDAITSTRAYRDSRTLEEGIDEIVSNAGTQFNIEVVSALLKLYKEKGEVLEKIHNDDEIEMLI